MTLQILHYFYRKTTMTLIQIFNNYFKKKTINLSSLFSFTGGKLKFENFKFLFLFSILLFFTIVYFTFVNFVDQKNQENVENLNTISKSTEFLNLSNYFISKINSPYKEIKYSIQNNDAIGKILKRYNWKPEYIAYRMEIDNG